MCKAGNWLRKHDQALYAKGVTIKTAKAMCEKAVGESIPGRQFKDLRRDHCSYFKKRRTISFSHQDALDEKQWDAVRAWIRRRREAIEAAESIEVVARLMRADKIIVNPDLLRGSCTFKDLWVRDLGREF